MYNNKKILAVIPARGGSKGLAGKNIKPLLGKPLILWSVEQAKNSKYIDEIFVSTDSREIADIVEADGHKIPYLRPACLADDNASSMDVLLNVIEFYEKNGQFFDIILLLQPTSPLRTPDDIDGAVEYFFMKKATGVISVTQAEHHPLWANVLPQDLSLKGFLAPEIKNKNRQQLPVYYRYNGAIYLTYTDYFKEHKEFLGDEAYAYVMPQYRSVDIDSIYDFKLAEIIMKEVLTNS